ILQGSLVIASGTGTNSATRTWASPTVLQGEQSYDVRVRVRESSGFWSPWDTQTILVQFDPPPEPTASVEWVAAGYYEVTGQTQSDGVLPDPVTLNLERSANGGPWQILAEDLGLEFTYFDWTAPMVGYIQYRVTAVSALPSTASTIVDSDRLPEDACEILLSGGDGYAVVARLLYEQRRQITAGRRRVLNEFDGRANPVSTSGLGTPLEFSVTATLAPIPDCGDGSKPVVTVQDLITLAELPGTHLYRDHEGFTFACHLSPIQIDPGFMGQVSFTVTRTDSPTQEQLLAISRYTGPMIVETRPGVYTVVGGDFVEGQVGE
ncbi:MAG TPA: hypothetical protein GX718_05440, partial [Brevibacterium sp.]|nr:hypothetical protein [Brevibacterium sp.]